MAIYSNSTGEQLPALQVAMDSTRRKFNFGDRVAELNVMQTPFFTYVAKLAKDPTDDPVFKMLEQRHQWQRRNFHATSTTAGAAFAAASPSVTFPAGAKYDRYGRVTYTSGNPVYNKPEFLLPNQVIVTKAEFSADSGTTWGSPQVVHILITSVDNPTANSVDVTGNVIAINGNKDLSAYDGQQIRVAADTEGVVIGTAFAEATGAPQGWKDELYPAEGYTQIFKTATPMFSGSALATRYRGRPDEFLRTWTEKLNEHKMDIEQALLFGVGRYESENGLEPKRYTWGIVPFTELYGNVFTLSYGSSGYNDFIDLFETFYAPESGNSGQKLWMASRSILAWLNKLGSSSFLGNSLSQAIRLNISEVQGRFGHKLLQVDTIFGTAMFVQQPLLRGIYEDYCVAVDLNNIKYRPLVGNGVNRDTFIETNVQANDVDGRIDQILTETGLEVSLPETHAVVKFTP